MSSDRKREVSAGSRDERRPKDAADAPDPAATSEKSGATAPEPSADAADDGATERAGEADAEGPADAEADAETGAEANTRTDTQTDTETSGEHVPDVVEEVRDALRELTGRLGLEADRAAHRESVIDRLHEENQRLRRGELESMLEPVRAALYKVHDTLRQAAASPPEPEQAAKLLGDCANEVADTLARTGSVRFEVEPGQLYDASRHRPVERVEVDDPDRDGTVLAVLSDGFEKGDRVVRKAGVRVGKSAESAKSGARRRAERDDGHRR